MAVIEETQLRATLLALDEINRFGGVNGHEIVLVIYDPQSDAQTYARCAKRLMIEDGVTMIFGCYTSSSRKAVLPVVERLNGLLWYPTPYEGFEFSSNIIYTGAAPNHHFMRRQAMSQRVSVGTIATAIIDSYDILG
jgi:ABC-type branched-subunit amino acid transport system substrate-binding protein